MSEDDRWNHLSRITRDGEENPWEGLEDEFYENPEDLDAMCLRYIAANPAEFSS